jgi:hypothetical protein
MKHLFLVLSAILLSITMIPVALANDSCHANCVYGLSEAEINAYPKPLVEQVYPNDQLLGDRLYRRVNEAVQIFDAPNGNVTGGLDAGFNFVTVQGSQDGWAQINRDQWVLADKLGGATVSRFAGVKITEPLPYPVAWILVNVIPSRAPGAEPIRGDLPILRYTLVNIYEVVEIEDWRWYQVGVNQWVHQTLVAKYLPIERPDGIDTHKWVSVDLYEQVAIAYEGSTPVFATLVSSGLKDWPTNEGLFHVYVRYPRTIMSGAQGKPDFYYLEEVPWTMYFDGDIALHGTYWHDGFGYRHSHGCVNLSIMDAYWLYNWASDEFDFTVDNDLGPAVYVYSSGEYK